MRTQVRIPHVKSFDGGVAMPSERISM
jgi:hypothetical protein